LEVEKAAQELDSIIHSKDKTIETFYIPSSAKSAVMKLIDAKGVLRNSYIIHERGNSQINISANSLDAGTYIYQLIIEGQIFRSNKMTLTK
jgi:hypothetical protein